MELVDGSFKKQLLMVLEMTEQVARPSKRGLASRSHGTSLLAYLLVVVTPRSRTLSASSYRRKT